MPTLSIITDIAATTSIADIDGYSTNAILVGIHATSSTNFPWLQAHKNLSIGIAATSLTGDITGVNAKILSKVCGIAATSSTDGVTWNRVARLLTAISVTSDIADIDAVLRRRVIAAISQTSLTDAISLVLGGIAGSFNLALTSATAIRELTSLTSDLSILDNTPEMALRSFTHKLDIVQEY